MKRTTYLLLDSIGTVRARMSVPEGETPDVEPWMLHNINSRGWRLTQSGGPEESGVVTHGYADWQMVADNLATCLRVVLDDTELSPEDADQVLERAQAALDDYDVAHMEVGVAEPHGPEESDEQG